MIELDARARLDLGNEIADRLQSAISDLSATQAWDLAQEIAQDVSDEAVVQERVVSALATIAKRAGIPTSAAARELLAADAERDAQNAATGAATREAELRSEWETHHSTRDYPRTAAEQDAWDRRAAELRAAVAGEMGPDALAELEREVR